MNPEIIAAIGGIFISTLTAFFGFLRYIVNKFLKELTPNGGKSLKDQINRLEAHHTRLDQRIDDIYNILITPKPKRGKKVSESD